MSNVTKPVILDETGLKIVEQLKTQNLLLSYLPKAIAGSTSASEISSVSEFAKLLGMGIGKDLLSIGKQFQVPKESAITLAVIQAEGSTLTATVDADAYLAAIGHADEHVYEATYDGAVWHKEDNETVILADYGITASGTAVVGDKIAITVTATTNAFDLVQYNPTDYELPYDTTGKGDCAMLQAHKIHAYGGVPFCPSQLMYYAATQALPAGTYKFTLYKARYGGGSEYDGTYKFTTTQAIPLYGGFRINGLGGWQSSYSATDVTSKVVSTYGAKFSSAATLTKDDRSKHIRSNLIENNLAITAFADADTYDYDLGTFTAQRADYYDEDDSTSGLGGKRNRMEQQCYGSNRYAYSTAHLYLNSDAAASSGDGLGNWYYYQSYFDLPPSATVCNYAGYMHGYGADFLNAIQKVSIKCALPAYYSESNTVSYETVEGYFFLISRTELDGVYQTSGVSEGAKLDYYTMYSTASDRKKLYGSSYQWWWTRSAGGGCSNIAVCVYSDGGVNYGDAGGARGLAPACIIKQSN